jgi:hypothetical protein
MPRGQGRNKFPGLRLCDGAYKHCCPSSRFIPPSPCQTSTASAFPVSPSSAVLSDCAVTGLQCHGAILSAHTTPHLASSTPHMASSTHRPPLRPPRTRWSSKFIHSRTADTGTGEKGGIGDYPFASLDIISSVVFVCKSRNVVPHDCLATDGTRHSWLRRGPRVGVEKVAPWPIRPRVARMKIVGEPMRFTQIIARVSPEMPALHACVPASTIRG